MEQNYSYEEEIDLKDLLYAVLKKWRPVLLSAVILALLLGAFQAVMPSAKSSGEAALAHEKEMEAYRDALSVYEGNLTRLEAARLQLEDANGLLMEELEKYEEMADASADEKLACYMNINVLRDSLMQAQKDIESLSDLKEPEEPVLLEEAVSGKVLKFALIGFVLGGFLSVFALCVAYLMSDKPRHLKELGRRFMVKELGEFYPEQKKKSVFAGIDRWLDRLFGYGQLPKEAEVYAMIAANVKNYTPDGVKKILLTGMADEHVMQKVEAALESAASELAFTVAPALCKSAEAISGLTAHDAVILIEERHKSSNAEIEAELSMIKNVGKEVIGMVLY